ncbi:MAG: hypothetical protein ABI954_02135 [Pyrinomonadaceae bacterium]
MKTFFRADTLVLSALVLGVLALTGCEQPGANTNLNANRPANSNMANTNLSTVNTNSVSTTNANAMNSAMIETREPEIYQATVALKLETMGSQQANLPPIMAQVARNGGDRRMEFTLPNKEKVIYLDAAGKHYLISPDRKQFAELNQESLGFEIRNLMTPSQIVQQVKNLKGVERVGEESVDGRTAIKYRYAGTTDTKSQAGNVQTESVILVDKETGLPLRSETNSQSETGQVKGVTGVRLITEMSNIQTTIAPDMFTPPTDYKQVAPEEVRGQVTALFNVAAALLGNVLKSAQPANSPAVSPTP